MLVANILGLHSMIQRQLRLMGVFSAINPSLGSVPLPAACWRGPAVSAPPAPSPAGTPPAPPPSARCPRAASAAGSAPLQPVRRPAGPQPAGNTHRITVDVQFYDKHEAEFGSLWRCWHDKTINSEENNCKRLLMFSLWEVVYINTNNEIFDN